MGQDEDGRACCATLARRARPPVHGRSTEGAGRGTPRRTTLRGCPRTTRVTSPSPTRASPSPTSGSTSGCCKALTDVGYESPSPIQAATIPALLEGRHVVGLAQTGTGKTAAFAVPILSQIDLKQKTPQALVLAPTRELALQVSEAFERYAAHLPGLHVLPIYGGQGYGVQLSALRRGVHVVVGTPGRIMDHLEKGTLDLSELRFLVLDEADEMLKMGFAEDVEKILSDTPDDKHVALFSATMPPQIRRISKKYLTDAAEITVKNKTTTSANTNQRYLIVSYPQKVDALTRILEVENFEGMIVFVRTKQVTEQLAERLRARGLLRRRDQRRHRPGPARAHHQPAPRGEARHPGRDRRRGPRARRRADLARRELRHPHRHRVLRAPHRPHRSRWPRAATRSRSSPRASGTCSRPSSGPPASRSRRCGCPRSRTSTRPGSRGSASRSPRRSRSDQVGVLPRPDQGLRAGARRAGRGHRRRARGADAGRPAAADGARAGARRRRSSTARARRAAAWDHEKGRRRDADDRPGDGKPGAKPRRARSDVPMATYRIAVGKRHKVEPRQIVGAIANEGGLDRVRLRAHRHPRRPLAGGAAGVPVGADPVGAGADPHLGQAHRAAPSTAAATARPAGRPRAARSRGTRATTDAAQPVSVSAA